MTTVTVEAGDRPLRDINRDIRSLASEASEIVVTDPLSRHNLAVALTEDTPVRIQGNVGYYCGGLNSGGVIHVEGDCGWGVGEAMARGRITIDGYAGMSVGASMRGGLIHIKGAAGPRCGVAQKGGDIVVEGDIGYLSGFMAHTGRIITLGNAGDATGDSLWEGAVWVAGDIKSLGVDSHAVEPSADEVSEVETLLDSLGLGDSAREWKKVVSGQRLWYFESRDSSAWLMI